MDLAPVQPFLEWLTAHPQWIALAITLIAFLESLAIAGIVIPGVLLLFGACAVAGSGTLGVWVTLSSALIGAILGDCVSFFLGKTLKDHIRDFWPFRNYPQWLDNGENFFNRHGGKSIMIGRFVGPIRPVLPLVAGMLDMSSVRFVSINFISALGWAPLYVLPGYLFGASLQQDINLPEGIGNLGWLLLGLCAGLFLFVRLSHWHLHPDSRLSLAIHSWIDKQHNVRIFWHWLAERRGEKPALPILSIILLIISLIAFSLTWLPSPNEGLWDVLNASITHYFSGLQHPWLDKLFVISLSLANTSLLLFFITPFIFWLLLKRHYAAALHAIVALIITPIISGVVTEINKEITCTTLGIVLTASFIAQEIDHHKRWWVYCFSLLPIMLMSISSLYREQSLLSEVLASIFMALIICAITRISFSRHNRRAIDVDISLAICTLIALISAGFYVLVIL